MPPARSVGGKLKTAARGASKSSAGAIRTPAPRSPATQTPATHGKRVTFDAETWAAVDLLARNSMKDFQELVDEAFRDLLVKHGRPTDLKTALRRSAARVTPANLKQKGGRS